MTPSNSRQASRGKPQRMGHGATPTATVRELASADIEADILSEAWRSGVGEPVSIHIRPAVYARLVSEMHSSRAEGSRVAARIPFVIDDRIPSAPGYEIHRAVPRGRAC
jgi:hypothetical protein